MPNCKWRVRTKWYGERDASQAWSEHFGGKLVEIGPVSEVFLNPQHDYTRTLLDAVPGGGWGQAAE